MPASVRRWLKMDLDRVKHIIFEIQCFVTKWFASGDSKINQSETQSKENYDGLSIVT